MELAIATKSVTVSAGGTLSSNIASSETVRGSFHYQDTLSDFLIFIRRRPTISGKSGTMMARQEAS